MSSRKYLLLVPVLLLCVPYLAAILYLIPVSLRDDGGVGLSSYVEIIARNDIVRAILNTFWVSFLVALVSMPIGIVGGLFVARRKRNQAFYLALILLPWLVSLVVRSFGWIVLLGNKGFLNSVIVALGFEPQQLIFTTGGVVAGLVHVLAPYAILTVMASALHQDPALEEAAGTLGASPFYSFTRVTLPLLMPGAVFGAVLVFLLSCGSVVTPLLLGGMRARMVGTQIYQDVFQLFDLPRAAAMSLMLMAMTLAIFTLAMVLRARFSRETEPVK